MKEYKEPELSILVLDYCKQPESFMLLESIKKHVKINHKIIFCDNGSGEDYPLKYLKDGLIDQLIVNRESLGLGLGTRDLINACQSDFFLYIQNDQVFIKDFNQITFDLYRNILNTVQNNKTIKSVSLAGYPCGPGVFSERANFMETKFYKSLEPLSFGGAGPWHEFPWREGQIQEIYKNNNWVHIADTYQTVQDNGVFSIRDMKESGVYVHRTDTKQLWCLVPPKTINPAYPKVNSLEFAMLWRGEWPDGKIPEAELKDSFDCWSNTTLGRMQDDYIRDLRRRFKEKGKL